MWIDQCPRCCGTLEVVGGSFDAQGMILTETGFSFIDAKQLRTSDELVRCRDCGKQYGPEELMREECA